MYTCAHAHIHRVRDTKTHSCRRSKVESKAKSRPRRTEAEGGLARTFSQISPNWTSARRSRAKIVACSCRSIDRSFSRAARVWSSGSAAFFGRPSRHPGGGLRGSIAKSRRRQTFCTLFGRAALRFRCVVSRRVVYTLMTEYVEWTAKNTRNIFSVRFGARVSRFTTCK